MGIKEEQRRLCEASTMHPDDDDAPARVVKQRALELDYREISLWCAFLRYASASSSNLVVRVPLELKPSSNMVALARLEQEKKF